MKERRKVLFVKLLRISLELGTEQRQAVNALLQDSDVLLLPFLPRPHPPLGYHKNELFRIFTKAWHTLVH